MELMTRGTVLQGTQLTPASKTLTLHKTHTHPNSTHQFGKDASSVYGTTRDTSCGPQHNIKAEAAQEITNIY
jgi:hypothetical protein